MLFKKVFAFIKMINYGLVYDLLAQKYYSNFLPFIFLGGVVFILLLFFLNHVVVSVAICE